MSKEDEFEITEDKSVRSLANRFATRAIKRVFIQIPATIYAIAIGAIFGGFLGLAFAPFAPLFSLLGAILLGTPVAIFEYKIKKEGGSSWDIS